MDATKLVDTLLGHIRAETGGWANRSALSRLDRLVNDLMFAPELSEGDRRSLRQVRDWAQILYSTRRHRRWETGASAIRRAMLLNMESIRSGIAPSC